MIVSYQEKQRFIGALQDTMNFLSLALSFESLSLAQPTPCLKQLRDLTTGKRPALSKFSPISTHSVKVGTTLSNAENLTFVAKTITLDSLCANVDPLQSFILIGAKDAFVGNPTRLSFCKVATAFRGEFLAHDLIHFQGP